MMSKVVFLSSAFENMAPKQKEIGTDVREMIVKCHSEGKNQIELARVFDIPRATIQRILKKYNDFGSVENRPARGRLNYLPRGMELMFQDW